MKFYCDVSDDINPATFKSRAKRAAHIVAAQAAKDMQSLVPVSSGALRSSMQVDGRVVTWQTPYAGTLFYGVLMVDPKYKKGGFPYANLGVIRSRKNVKKVTSERQLTYKIGEKNWIQKGKRLYGDRWMRMAKEALLHG